MEVFKCNKCETWFEENDVNLDDDNECYCVKCGANVTEDKIVDALEQLNS